MKTDYLKWAGRRTSFWSAVGAGMATMAFVPLAVASATFTPLGALVGPGFTSWALSGDGLVVIGYQIDQSGIPVAVSWSPERGRQVLGSLPGLPFSAARAVSADGSAIAGDAYDGTVSQAFLWTANGGLNGLGVLPGGIGSSAYAISSDGTAVVGEATGGTGAIQAFRWTLASGMVGLGSLSNSINISRDSTARGVSADGSVVVGEATDAQASLQAFRWTAATGMVGLGYPPGAFTSTATATSADGSVVAGDAQYADGGIRIFRWTASNGMKLIPGPLGDPNGVFFNMSADGKVILGSSSFGSFRWTEGGGSRLMREILEIYGVDLSGWDLYTVNGISADGYTFAGNTGNPQGGVEGWIAHISPGAPAAGRVSAQGFSETKVTWKPAVFDPEGDSLKCWIINAPANGIATVASNCSSGTYQSSPGFIGTDSFTYIANDGQFDGNLGTVTIAVTEPPVDTVCAQQYPVSQLSQTGKDGTLTITFTGNITSHTNKEVKVCPGTTLNYQTTSTQGPVVCKVKNNTTAGSGTLKINDHLKCTDKPAGKDKVSFKVKSGVTKQQM